MTHFLQPRLLDIVSASFAYQILQLLIVATGNQISVEVAGWLEQLAIKHPGFFIFKLSISFLCFFFFGSILPFSFYCFSRSLSFFFFCFLVFSFYFFCILITDVIKKNLNDWCYKKKLVTRFQIYFSCLVTTSKYLWQQKWSLN